jgi:hypothetical protein
MTKESRSYSKKEMLAGGFEARCDLPDGTRYLWHGGEGIRVDSADRVRWLGDPASLPDGDWYPTELGEAEIGGSQTPRPVRTPRPRQAGGTSYRRA